MSDAAELASQTETLGPVSGKINLLATEFNFDEIAKFADDERILWVDDQPTHLPVFFQTLDGCTYNLLKATNCELALSMACKANPDPTLRDIMMPGVAGYEVCRR